MTSAHETAPVDRGLPGGVAVSRLRVYDWVAADGVVGGSPHLHTASTESYVVVAGAGAVQTISAEGFRETPIAAGSVVWFTPGTVHRLVNGDGALEIVAVMQNAGLPESGDAVFTFPLEILRDPARYREAATLPDSDLPSTTVADAARARRDLAVQGWHQLRERIAIDPDAALAELYDAAARLVSDRVDGWRELWRNGPMAQATDTARQLDELAEGRAPHLMASAVRQADPQPGPERFGMCGRLTVWNLEGAQ